MVNKIGGEKPKFRVEPINEATSLSGYVRKDPKAPPTPPVQDDATAHNAADPIRVTLSPEAQLLQEQARDPRFVIGAEITASDSSRNVTMRGTVLRHIVRDGQLFLGIQPHGETNETLTLIDLNGTIIDRITSQE